jgi:hypothetical protein
MAAIGTAITLNDIAKAMDPNGQIARVIELLSENNEILMDMPFMEGNLPTGHRSTVRTGIPTATWRKLNYGVAPTKGTTKQVDDVCGLLETYVEADKDLVKLNGNKEQYMLTQFKAHMEGIHQGLANALFYGDSSTDPEKIMGFGPRYNLTSAENGSKILNCGGSSNLTSIWLIGWGDTTVNGIYPKASSAGLSFEDLGQETKSDSNGLLHQVYRSHFQWKVGLAVPDWRYVVRIANIDTSLLVKDAATGADLIDKMTQALELIHAPTNKMSFYCNRTIRSFLRRQIQNKTNYQLTLDTVAGKKVLSFGEAPVRRVDQIVNTETAIS